MGRKNIGRLAACISNQLGWKLLADETSRDWLWYLWTVRSAQPLKFCVIRQIIRFPLLRVSILYKLHYLCMPTITLNCSWIAMYIAKCTYFGLCISVCMLLNKCTGFSASTLNHNHNHYHKGWTHELAGVVDHPFKGFTIICHGIGISCTHN